MRFVSAILGFTVVVWTFSGYVSCCKRCDEKRKVLKWGNWSPCSVTCGDGSATRYKYYKDKKTEETCSKYITRKACNNRPCPTDCVWGSWGPWSLCSAGEETPRSRSRNVSYPALYGGELCDGENYEFDFACAANGSEVARRISRLVKDTGLSEEVTHTEHLAGLPHQCNSRRLKCNGDVDCYDSSDERDCFRLHKQCPRATGGLIPNIHIAGAGFNILKGEHAGSIFDNTKFRGTCHTVHLGEHQELFRKPYNVHTYLSSTVVVMAFQIKSFNDAIEFSEEKTKGYENKIAIGVAVSYGGVKLGASVARSEEFNWKTMIESSMKSDSKYFTASQKIEIGKFRLNRHNAVYSSTFLQRMSHLPSDYDFSRYSQFISDFGTHYYSEGTLGGALEITYEYSRSDLRKTSLSEEQQKECLMAKITASTVVAEASVSSTACRMKGSSHSERKSFASSSKNSVSRVYGGTAAEAAALALLGDEINPEKYQQWADTIKHNPAIIDYKLTPISDLVHPRSKQLNVERALAELFEAFDSQRCEKRGYCKNGGKFDVVDRGRQCICLCPAGFHGVACQNDS